jgi:pimeloyl-ACP methyl ester carboxylesterase
MCQPRSALCAHTGLTGHPGPPVVLLPGPNASTPMWRVNIPVLALIAGQSVMLDAALATSRARCLLPRGQIELWADASHAINGEYPFEIAERAAAFWADVDAAGNGVSSQ